MILHLGFEERIHGSHHVFRSSEMPSVKLVLRPDGKDAKPYQVAQVRNVVLALNAGEQDNG